MPLCISDGCELIVSRPLVHRLVDTLFLHIQTPDSLTQTANHQSRPCISSPVLYVKVNEQRVFILLNILKMLFFSVSRSLRQAYTCLTMKIYPILVLDLFNSKNMLMKNQWTPVQFPMLITKCAANRNSLILSVEHFEFRTTVADSAWDTVPASVPDLSCSL